MDPNQLAVTQGTGWTYTRVTATDRRFLADVAIIEEEGTSVDFAGPYPVDPFWWHQMHEDALRATGVIA